jgi:transposase, IS30 family
MGEQYNRLTEAERITLQLMHEKGHSLGAIARKLGRSPSTLSRELRRQPDHGQLPYEASRAHAQALWQSWACRNPRKLRPGNRLFATVARRLRQGWSPLQIAGRLQRMHPDQPARRVCHETIYLALYALPRGALRRELLACLRQGHKTRWPRSRGTKRRERIAEALRIAARPEAVAERRIPGHWEGDLIKGAGNKSAVGTLVERTSRLVVLARMPGLDALAAQQAFERVFTPLPAALRKTLTYDRGSEMARHAALTKATGVKVYFADPYSPWQRASNENANGLIREYLPKGTDLSGYSQADLDAIARQLNTRPRAVLDFQTPQEVFDQILARQKSANSAVALAR